MIILKKRSKQLVSFIRILLIFCFLIIVLFPFYWQFLTSLKPTREIADISLVPNWKTASLHAYHFILTERPFLRYMLNSLMVSLITTAISVLIACMAARHCKTEVQRKSHCAQLYSGNLDVPEYLDDLPNLYDDQQNRIAQYLVGFDYTVFVVCYAFVGVVFDHILRHDTL